MPDASATVTMSQVYFKYRRLSSATTKMRIGQRLNVYRSLVSFMKTTVSGLPLYFFTCKWARIAHLLSNIRPFWIFSSCGDQCSISVSCRIFFLQTPVDPESKNVSKFKLQPASWKVYCLFCVWLRWYSYDLYTTSEKRQHRTHFMHLRNKVATGRTEKPVGF